MPTELPDPAKQGFFSPSGHRFAGTPPPAPGHGCLNCLESLAQVPRVQGWGGGYACPQDSAPFHAMGEGDQVQQ